MRRRSCAAGQRPGTGRGRGRRHRARPGRRARRARRPRTRTPPGGSGWRGAPGRAGPGSPRAGTAAPRRPPCCRAGPRGRGRRAGPGGGGCGSAARGPPCTGRRCRPGPVPASPRPGRPTRSSVRYPGAAASRKACGRPAPMPRRRASIAASISAAAAGGALRYRASSSGAPARNWITSPSGADRAASTIRASAARASWPICAGVNAAGTVMSCPASSSRAWACGSVAAGRAGGQGVPELGPQRGQHQHRGPAGVAQQLPQPGGDPLAQPGLGGVEVELGLVQPHHGPRPDARQLGQRRIRAGRVDRMPQPPRRVLVPQQGQGLPAGPGLARGGPADQHRDPAAARPPPRAPPGPAPGRARAARTAAGPAAPAARPRAAPAGAPPARTGRSPPPAAAPPPQARPGPRPPGGRPPARPPSPRPGRRTAPGCSRRRSTATTSSSSPGSSLSSNRAGSTYTPASRTARASAARRSSRVQSPSA